MWPGPTRSGRSTPNWPATIISARGGPWGIISGSSSNATGCPSRSWSGGPSCYALKDRDRWLGWSTPQRVARLKLIVQNRRFLVLSPKGQSPNLASQAMGAALRALPDQWAGAFGYRPLLAESFTDPEASAGTCYKAQGQQWEPVGFSAGYSRHRADFYIANERPKKLWLRELCPKARTLLRAVQVPEAARAGLGAPPSGALPVTQPQMTSLADVFRHAPDPRAQHPFPHRPGAHARGHGAAGRAA